MKLRKIHIFDSRIISATNPINRAAILDIAHFIETINQKYNRMFGSDQMRITTEFVGSKEQYSLPEFEEHFSYEDNYTCLTISIVSPDAENSICFKIRPQDITLKIDSVNLGKVKLEDIEAEVVAFIQPYIDDAKRIPDEYITEGSDIALVVGKTFTLPVTDDDGRVISNMKQSKTIGVSSNDLNVDEPEQVANVPLGLISINEDEKSLTVNQETIQNKIYQIRGLEVMLDSDLAEIYGYSTKNFNRQVKNNAAKFEGEDFMFQLTSEEAENLRCKNFTSRWGGTRYLPYAFTEQGIYMLMTVLKGDLAISQSRALVRIFKRMKDHIIENRDFLGPKEILQISTQTYQNTLDISKIREEMASKRDLQKFIDSFSNPETYKHFLILDGQKFEADIAYSKIYDTAQKSIYVVDDYLGLKTLELLRSANPGVSIIIFSDNKKCRTKLTSEMLDDFHSTYPSIQLKIRTTNGKYHDRYIIIDYNTKNESIYHCGASSKDAGNKITTIAKIEDNDLYRNMIEELMKHQELVLGRDN